MAVEFVYLIIEEGGCKEDYKTRPEKNPQDKDRTNMTSSIHISGRPSTARRVNFDQLWFVTPWTAFGMPSVDGTTYICNNRHSPLTCIKGVRCLARVKGAFAQVKQTFDNTFTTPLISIKRVIPLTRPLSYLTLYQRLGATFNKRLCKVHGNFHVPYTIVC